MPVDLESMRLTADKSWEVTFDATKLVFGVDSLDSLGELTRELGAGEVLIVTDPGLARTGHVERALEILARASLSAHVFDGVEQNPTTRHVEEGSRFAAAQSVDCIIGMGGGSSMDCAKAINFLLTNGGKMEDYWGVGKATRPLLPSLGVPTTAGTGSEAQSFTLISQPGSGVKMACGDRKAKFRAVVLDPRLTLTVPSAVTATAGIDAISHAVESYVTRTRNPISTMLAREAWRLLEPSLETALQSPDDLEARSRMLLGSHLAGAAIEHSMLGAAHACANPLTARHGVIHGHAVGLMLPPVVRFNAGTVGELYGELAPESSATGSALADRICRLRADAGLPERLRDCGVARGDLPVMAEEAAAQWTAGFNPIPVTTSDLLGFYESAY